MSTYIVETNELRHAGIKDMKWGVRRYQNKDGSLTPAGKKRYAAEAYQKRTSYKSAKNARTEARVDKSVAKKRYDDAFNRAYKYSERHPIGQYISKKGRLESDKLWKDANDTREAYESSKRRVKQADKDYKQAKREYKEAKSNAKYEKYGLDPTNPDHVYNATRLGYKGAQNVQKRINNKNMSELGSYSIEAGKQAAVSVLATYGVIAVAGLVSKYSNPTSMVLDASGKVLKRMYD